MRVVWNVFACFLFFWSSNIICIQQQHSDILGNTPAQPMEIDRSKHVCVSGQAVKTELQLQLFLATQNATNSELCCLFLIVFRFLFVGCWLLLLLLMTKRRPFVIINSFLDRPLPIVVDSCLARLRDVQAQRQLGSNQPR
jgi:hypothetical protein